MSSYLIETGFSAEINHYKEIYRKKVLSEQGLAKIIEQAEKNAVNNLSLLFAKEDVMEHSVLANPLGEIQQFEVQESGVIVIREFLFLPCHWGTTDENILIVDLPLTSKYPFLNTIYKLDEPVSGSEIMEVLAEELNSQEATEPSGGLWYSLNNIFRFYLSTQCVVSVK